MRIKLNPLPNKASKALERFAPPSLPTVKPTSTKTRMYTYFTEAGETKLLYSAETWVKARLILEDAGPVAIGTDQNITPVLSGKGIVLPTGVEVEFYISRGDRIFIAAEAVNRVRFIIDPIPFLGSIQMALDAIVNLIGRKS